MKDEGRWNVHAKMVGNYLVVLSNWFANEMVNEVLRTSNQASLPLSNVLPLIKQLHKLVKAMYFSGTSYPRE